MLGQILSRVGRSLATRQEVRLACYKQLSHGPLLRATGQLLPLHSVRYFSSEMTKDWPQGIRSFLERERISEPTPIQERTLPSLMQNKDLVGIARTGSGKTLAFVIPAVMKILKERESGVASGGGGGGARSTAFDDDSDERMFMRKSSLKLPSCLILAPTRELASQTADVCRKFNHLGIKSISLVGGASRNEQVRQLGRGDQDIYIGTPGRLMDLMETQTIDLSEIKYLVLDEADRMLDMGFEPQIRKIINNIPKERQTLMFSATWPQEIQALASEFLRNFEYVAVDSEKLKANPNIKQIVEICEPGDKMRIFLNHLRQFEQEYRDPRTLVFVNTKRLADTLLLHLMRNRFKAIAMHGDRSQAQRDHALRMFRDKLCHVMVATDVAARGLDINDITHVINFDFPNTIEDYIHRIGRTARHEKTGTALSLFTENNAGVASKLIRVLQETNQEVPEQLLEFANNKHRYNTEPRDFQKRRTMNRRDDPFYRGGPSRPRRFDRYEDRDSYNYRDNYRDVMA